MDVDRVYNLIYFNVDSCPFVEKFSLEIETYYTPDGGEQENVFNLKVFRALSSEDIFARIIISRDQT